MDFVTKSKSGWSWDPPRFYTFTADSDEEAARIARSWWEACGRNPEQRTYTSWKLYKEIDVEVNQKVLAAS